MKAPVGLAPLTLDDLDRVVQVHQEAFAGSGITALGPSVVRRYYRWQLAGPHPHPFGVGAWSDGQLQGMIFGGVRHRAVVGFVRTSIPWIAAGAVRHPGAFRALEWPRVAGVARLMVRVPRPAARSADVEATASDAEPRSGRSFGVLSIAVRNACRGSGVAEQLLAAAAGEARGSGYERMHLTVQPENARAIAFYEKHGWRRVCGESGWDGRMEYRIAPS